MSSSYLPCSQSQCLIGKKTAIKLGILRIGLGINNIDEHRPFPKFKDVVVEILINYSVKPIAQPYRRVAIPLEDLIVKKLDELNRADIVEPVDGPSAWVFAMVPVLKGIRDVRICIDMRLANRAISRVTYPLPTIDDLLPQFCKAKYVSRLDIKNAFHQLEISEKSRHISNFVTKKGLFRYKRLMFGINCAPEIFQKTLEQILIGCKGCYNYIDGIGVSEKAKKNMTKT